MELVIAVSVVAILSTIAIPSYQANIRRTNRAIAKGMLSDLAAKQEVQNTRRSQYLTDFTVLVSSTNANATNFYLSRNGIIATALDGNGTSIYKIELLNPTTTSFTLSATAVGKQALDKDCQTFTLNSVGQKSATALAGGDTSACWR